MQFIYYDKELTQVGSAPTEPKYEIPQVYRAVNYSPALTTSRVESFGKINRSSTEKIEEGNIVKQKSSTNNVREDEFDFSKLSPDYMSFNTKSMINKIVLELDFWIGFGTDDSYQHIAKIKDYLHEYEHFLSTKPENRMLLGALELLFQNNNWEVLPKSKLNALRLALKKLSSGSIAIGDLNVFTRFMISQNISPLV